MLLPAKKEKTDETNTLEISSQAVQVTLCTHQGSPSPAIPRPPVPPAASIAVAAVQGRARLTSAARRR